MSQFLPLLFSPFSALFLVPLLRRRRHTGRRRKEGGENSFHLSPFPPSFPRFFVVPSFFPPFLVVAAFASLLKPPAIEKGGTDSSSSSFQSPFLLRSSFLLITEKGGEEEASVGKPTLAARSSEGGEGEGDFQVHYPSRREGREEGDSLFNVPSFSREGEDE